MKRFSQTIGEDLKYDEKPIVSDTIIEYLILRSSQIFT